MSFFATGVVVVGSVLVTGVVTGSFLMIGVFGELVFNGVKSILTGVDSLLAGVDAVLAGIGVEPLIAAAFLAYQKEEYVYK